MNALKDLLIFSNVLNITFSQNLVEIKVKPDIGEFTLI